MELFEPAGSTAAVHGFRALAEETVDELLALDPVTATYLGDHRHDDRLPDLSRDAVAAARALLSRRIAELDAVDDVALGRVDATDLEILRARLTATEFALGEVRRHEWDPLEWNPGSALHLLLARDFAPLEERLLSVAARLAAVPDQLATARATLADMPRVHVETAIEQFRGTVALLTGEMEEALAEEPDLREVVVPVRQGALDALDEHVDWLVGRLPQADRDPRLGPALYAGVLWHSLDSEMSPEQLRALAAAEIDRVEERLREVAAELGVAAPGTGDLVRSTLERLAADAVVTDGTVLAAVERAIAVQTAFVRDHGLVTVPDTDTVVVEMPEIHRGVAVAYCDAPGPLEAAEVSTYVAVSPTPRGWSDDRVLSFYREYNGHLLEDLAVHEAVPGHVLQLAHARQVDAPTRVRAFASSGAFVEGWAVYAEELMVARGYAGLGGAQGALALEMQQLKMRLRVAINALLDVGVHAGDMDETEALDLMMRRGHQEEGEAVGKWRRALLTAGQLPTYFAGYLGVREVVDDLRVLHPDWDDRALHDTVLGHGSPAPRHLRNLLGI